VALSCDRSRWKPFSAFRRISSRSRRGSGGSDPAVQKANAEELRKWRVGVPMSKVQEFRKKWNDAGVLIEIVKTTVSTTSPTMCWTIPSSWQRTSGLKRSCEIDVHRPNAWVSCRQAQDDGRVSRPHRDRPSHWESVSYARHAGRTSISGISWGTKDVADSVPQAASRSDHAHSREGQDARRQERAVRQGDTPIKEALQTIRDNKWLIQATIEFEYQVPEGSDRMKEIAKCVQYCKDALLG
jgi:hypothetical protein